MSLKPICANKFSFGVSVDVNSEADALQYAFLMRHNKPKICSLRTAIKFAGIY